MLRVISQAVPETDFVLRLTYSDGDVVKVDFKPLIKQGGVFAALADPDLFRQVSVGERGRFIQWPGEIDFCADALWLQQHTEGDSAA